MVALLLVVFCSEAGEGFGIFGEIVGFSGGAFADSFVVVKSVGGGWSVRDYGEEGLGIRRARPLSMEALKALYVLVLRHCDGLSM